MLDHSHVKESSQAVLEASDGIRQSPLGDSATEPTFGASGEQERLNCCEKKRRVKVFNHFSSVSPLYVSPKAYMAMRNSFSGGYP